MATLKKMNKSKLKFLIIVFLILLFTYIFYQKIELYPPKNIDIVNTYGFKLTDSHVSEDEKIYDIEARKNNIFTKIKIIKDIGEKASDGYQDYQLKMINSIFEPLKTPYPSMVTNERICPEEFKPLKVNKNNTNSTYYLMYSTNRYSYGACSWDSVKYRVILLFRYCENDKELYRIELFIPIDDFNESYTKMAEKIRCK